MTSNLQHKLRSAIDDIDAAIITLIAERMALASAIGQLKAEGGRPIGDPAREASVVANAAKVRPLSVPIAGPFGPAVVLAAILITGVGASLIRRLTIGSGRINGLRTGSARTGARRTGPRHRAKQPGG